MSIRHLKPIATCLACALAWTSVAPGLVLAQRLRPLYEAPATPDPSQQPYGQQSYNPSFISSTATLPAGTLIITQMLTKLSSKTAQPGDRLRAKVIVPVSDRNGRVLIPVGSTIEGQVQDVLRAKSRRRSGMLEISFDRLRMADGQAIPLNATLAPATAEDRKRLDEDGRLYQKGGNEKRTVAFIGGGVGAGAIIGYFTAGALLGAGVGAGIGVAAALMAKGHEANVELGMKIGAELLEPIQVRTSGNTSSTVANNSRLEPYKPGKPSGNTSTYDPRETNYDTNPAPPRDPYYTPPPTSYTPPATTPLPPYDPYEIRKPAAKPTPRPTTRPTTPSSNSRPAPAYNEPTDANVNTADLELVSLINMLAERGSDETVRVSLTAQTPTAGWRLMPQSTIQNGVLNIKLMGAPPRGLAAQVMSSASTVVVKPDPNREIQRITIRSSTGVRTTVPIMRGQKPATTGGGGSSSAPIESSSPMGLRIADKADALVEDFARTLRAWKQTRDGQYSFDNPREASSPEAQLLYAFDRLSESANVFRSSLTPERKREAVRGILNAHKQIERLWPFVKVTMDVKQRWQEIHRDTNQLAATVPGSTTSSTPLRPRS